MGMAPRRRNGRPDVPAKKCGRCTSCMLPPGARRPSVTTGTGLMAWHIPCKFRAP
jgi:hypothetical protein